MIDVFPIRTEADYKKALHLLEHTKQGTTEAEDRIEVLAQLVELWEKKHFAEPLKPSAGEALRELMLLKRTTQGELASLLRTPKSNISALLTGKRKLNSDQVALLCEFFEVEAVIFGEVKRARLQISEKGGRKFSKDFADEREQIRKTVVR